VLGQALDPFPFVRNQDRDHELIDPIGDGSGTSTQWHGGSFAETCTLGQDGRMAQT
jgi:hypothetical protein